jgi:hypothetical protein
MALRTFNSVGGFSVGEVPVTIILANGDITTANGTFTGNITSGNANLGNLATANFFSGTLTTNAQPNITSLGTLISLNVSGNANVDGNVNAGNLFVSSRVISNLIPGTSNNYNLGSSSLFWNNAYIGGNILFNSSAYINASGNTIQTDAANVANDLAANTLTIRNSASIGTDLTVTGNLTVSGTTTYINVVNMSSKDPLIQLGGGANGANASTYDAKDRGVYLQDYKTDGTGVLNHFIGWDSSNAEFAFGANVSQTDNVVTFNELGNVRGNVFLGNLQGTILTASQTNITEVGTLGNLQVSGNLRVDTVGNIATLIAGGLTYPIVDGTAGQVLTTYGNTKTYWKTIDTSVIANGSSNIFVYNNGNVTASVGGTANVFTITSSGANLTGNLDVSGKVTFNTVEGNSITIKSTIISANSITTSSVTANQTIASVDGSVYRGVIFDVKGVDSVGAKYTMASVSAIHNGTSADYAVYGTVTLGGTTGTLSVNYSAGNINLNVTPSSSNSTVWTTQYRAV